MTVLFKPILALHIIFYSFFKLSKLLGGGGGQNDMFAHPNIFIRGVAAPPPPPPPGSTPLPHAAAWGRGQSCLSVGLMNVTFSFVCLCVGGFEKTPMPLPEGEGRVVYHHPLTHEEYVSSKITEPASSISRRLLHLQVTIQISASKWRQSRWSA